MYIFHRITYIVNGKISTYSTATDFYVYDEYIYLSRKEGDFLWSLFQNHKTNNSAGLCHDDVHRWMKCGGSMVSMRSTINLWIQRRRHYSS